jgi:hypothetical protein
LHAILLSYNVRGSIIADVDVSKKNEGGVFWGTIDCV